MRTEFKPVYQEIGANISYYRRKDNMTQEALAEAADIAQAHMSHIEVGSSAPSIDVMIAIAKTLKIPLHKFFEFRD